MKYAQSKVRYDIEADIAYVELTNNVGFGEIADTIMAGEANNRVRTTIALDFDKDGKLLGVEIDDASKVLRTDLLNEFK